jgi:chromosome segregation ATPase
LHSSFLPQDKVAEFARMNPQQLLRETQRAAGDKRLTEWHDTLIESGKEMRELAEKLASDRERLQTQVERNQQLERDVERFNARKTIERDVSSSLPMDRPSF